MRGPLLSGPLGSATALDALVRMVAAFEPLIVLGPLWLGERLASTARVVMLVEPHERPRATRARRRARKANHALDIAVGADALPVRQGAVGALVVESIAGLPPEEGRRWVAALTPCLRPGGRMVAVDATSSPAAAARVAGVFLSAALTELEQEWPRDGVVMTLGVAPVAPIVDARFQAEASSTD
jgi:hypothetical protein